MLPAWNDVAALATLVVVVTAGELLLRALLRALRRPRREEDEARKDE